MEAVWWCDSAAIKVVLLMLMMWSCDADGDWVMLIAIKVVCSQS